MPQVRLVCAFIVACFVVANASITTSRPEIYKEKGSQLDSLWDLWPLLAQAKYIDLSHVIKPAAPVWYGFKKPQNFSAAVNASSGQAFTFKDDGFEATSYCFSTDQLGSQLDPPAHWNPWFPAIDEIPASYAVRPLVVISIVDKVKSNPGYQMDVNDILHFEKQYGQVPPDSVVMVRSDDYKRWEEPGYASRKQFPGITLAALKLLHLQRRILLHGHEPLDTDTTPGLDGEAWLLRNGYTQAEGVRGLDLVPPTGCLVSMGWPRLAGGTGGYARYVAICPPSWPQGVGVEETRPPLPRQAQALRWSAAAGHRVRG